MNNNSENKKSWPSFFMLLFIITMEMAFRYYVSGDILYIKDEIESNYNSNDFKFPYYALGGNEKVDAIVRGKKEKIDYTEKVVNETEFYMSYIKGNGFFVSDKYESRLPNEKDKVVLEEFDKLMASKKGNNL